jgi:hypothetical protein
VKHAAKRLEKSSIEIVALQLSSFHSERSATLNFVAIQRVWI